MSKSIISFSHLISKIFLSINLLLVLIFGILFLTSLCGWIHDPIVPNIGFQFHLSDLTENYPVKILDSDFQAKGIQIKKAELEIESIKYKRMICVLGYLLAAAYFSFYVIILYWLSRILSSFNSSRPFTFQNVKRIRGIAATIFLGVMCEYFIYISIYFYFKNKFVIENAEPNLPGITDINWELIFVSLVIFALAEVFKRGSELEELEKLTI